MELSKMNSQQIIYTAKERFIRRLEKVAALEKKKE